MNHLALRCLALTAAAVTTAVLATACGNDASGTPGAQTLGDRLFPELGNGGYDTELYEVSYDYRPESPTMDSTVRMTARATQDLSEFSLDSAGQRLESVRVDGTDAQFRTEREKLIITPKSSVPEGDSFTVDITFVADRSANPLSPALNLPPDLPPEAQAILAENTPWVAAPDGFALLGQPDRAHVFFPSNDHPRDKAIVSFRVSTPADVQAVANGTRQSSTTDNGRTTVVYRTAQPIPTHVVQVAVGRLTEIDATANSGLPLRSYVPTAQTDALRPVVARTAEQLAWLETTLGRPFPFEQYGVLGVDSSYRDSALETATLSTFGATALAGPEDVEAPTMMHELVHQYFGDAVALWSWDDMWLSEGHAMYYQNRYAADRGFLDFEQRMLALYQSAAAARPDDGPPTRLSTAGGVLSDTDAPGAVTLYALRNTVGEDTFHRIEQTFLDRFLQKSASTADYVKVASEVAGRDLGSFFDEWLSGPNLPPMPGHPDWKPAE
ncbi:M1 family metallopeptidase [Nocardia sp. NPDC058705]|uniref:M1 family metallopeptidase n=1 Tax=Nocardia sp. NPDC058705 TaxID=3346609 RepID=UPI0036AFE41F